MLSMVERTVLWMVSNSILIWFINFSAFIFPDMASWYLSRISEYSWATAKFHNYTVSTVYIVSVYSQYRYASVFFASVFFLWNFFLRTVITRWAHTHTQRNPIISLFIVKLINTFSTVISSWTMRYPTLWCTDQWHFPTQMRQLPMKKTHVFTAPSQIQHK